MIAENGQISLFDLPDNFLELGRFSSRPKLPPGEEYCYCLS